LKQNEIILRHGLCINTFCRSHMDYPDQIAFGTSLKEPAMNLIQRLFLAATLAASLGANASVVGSLGGGEAPQAILTGPGTFNSGGMLSGAFSATISGGQVFPAGFAPGINLLAVGPSFGALSTLTFATPVDYITFGWHDPRVDNVLEVSSTGGGPNVQIFTPTSLGFPAVGNPNFTQFVQFAANIGSEITQLRFSSAPDAFQTAFFHVAALPGHTTSVPEPGTLALMIISLGALALSVRPR
jgi:hypothetical protein